jgi:hypothetical protein
VLTFSVIDVSTSATLMTDTLSTEPNGWTYYTYQFTATGGHTKLVFADAGTSNSLGTFLDDVSVKRLSGGMMMASSFGGDNAAGAWLLAESPTAAPQAGLSPTTEENLPDEFFVSSHAWLAFDAHSNALDTISEEAWTSARALDKVFAEFGELELQLDSLEVEALVA